jgi:hypothetical protein
MAFELNDGPEHCSRRYLLFGAVAAVGAAAGICSEGTSANAAVKISEAAVAYQDHPNGDRQCSKCAEFEPPSSCKMVTGTISPQGYCRIFTPIRPAAARSRASPPTA